MKPKRNVFQVVCSRPVNLFLSFLPPISFFLCFYMIRGSYLLWKTFWWRHLSLSTCNTSTSVHCLDFQEILVVSCWLIFCYFAGWKKRVRLMYLYEGAEALRNRDHCLDDNAQWCPPQFHRWPGHRGLLHLVSSAGTQHFDRHPVRGVPSWIR